MLKIPPSRIVPVMSKTVKPGAFDARV